MKNQWCFKETEDTVESLKLVILRRIGIVAWASVASLAGAACGAGSANAPPPATAAGAAAGVDEQAAGLVEHHRYHPGGVTRIITMSLDTLGLSPGEQAAIEKIRSDLEVRMEPARAAQQRLITVLGDGLVAATFDPAIVDSAIAQVATAAAQVHDAAAEALNQLHAQLTPPERTALADKVESHWAVWQSANMDEGERTDQQTDRLTMLASELELTQAQVGQIRANLGDRAKTAPRLDSQAIGAYVRAFGDAFRSDMFDAKTLPNANAVNPRLAGWSAAQLARFVQAASPVLTPEQRSMFAQRLREHAAHNRGGSQ
jgi:Spy/CpxP family protein refolding chaperone